MCLRYNAYVLVFFVGLAATTGVQGQTNASLYFDGLDDQVMLPSDMLHSQSAFSISLWVRTYRGGMIFTNHNPGFQWESIELATTWYVINSGSGTGTRQILDVMLPADSLWHHIVGVWDGVSSRVYYDGTLHAGPLDAPRPPFNSFSPMRLGGPSARPPIIGYMDEVSLWSIALSEGQIHRVMRDTLGPSYYAAPDSGLIAYWRFDEPGGDTVFDMTDSHHDGTLAGATRTDVQSPVAIGSEGRVPISHRLDQNYPNPFNPTTTIRYVVPRLTDATLAVYDVLGREVSVLVSGMKPAGTYKVSFDASGLPSGIYLYSLRSEGFGDTKRMVVVQ